MRLHPVAADGLIAAALTTVAVLLGTEAVAQGWPALDPLAWTLVALLNLPLTLRTRAPVTVCLAVHACWSVYVTLGYWPVVGSFGPMLALYTVASLCSTRTAAAGAALLAGVWIYAGVVSDAEAMASVVGQAVGFPLVLWRFGYVARRTGELTRQLRAEQADRARREVAEERVRIARELHDVVAHHIAVINVQAGLARFVFHSDARTARGALDTIEGASGEALAELRRMLGLLRADGVQGADGAPAPGLGQLDEMVTRVRSGGVSVELRVTGAPRPLPPGVQLCVYRVVQEALTNVLKHAPGANATVELAYRAGEVTVSVTDDGRGEGGRAGDREDGREGDRFGDRKRDRHGDRQGDRHGDRWQGVDSDTIPERGGHGLIGMRERAKLYGGTIVVGPRSEGGFGVRLTLPTPVQTARRGDALRE
ncbi:sensor histidine kinase [Streptomyces pactum]|uniref:histidine kinase n=1 Tax=Streptomyces pactum TaxID=68249 RepID=A0A1S6J9R3_9ACTN|nr:sensor histidine kinase [Streptomyces pactum]AQS68487.1 sensor histidine kinase [Streptomyces pactum]